mmetsp:Transcript_493/g.1203  ORF Transcript_493/g.1203 Transcript_493/m.1203 type:complete len:311 (-) Transcript_493:137-1069(-)|eukprot:CAMPEP_0171501402 /NCGR_PEP_ID=MMETSP0958-20121227/9537_1 /TAXON_ID=87120 /ORGANISM="Aurantiochytrium limacinum, Strain ATCCMYA-1381" /LENGTH=310 /DNA_ID=CAMNT_0012036211 /DNA_START=835 /DNA_END=1767 /DNA_ORIENTATION=+
MFARKLGYGYEGSVKRVKRSFGRGIPFELETRKRQAVTCGLPKLEASEQEQKKQSANMEAKTNSTKAQQQQQDERTESQPREDKVLSGKPAPTVYMRESRLQRPQIRKSKSICFAEGTKTWMGLRRECHYLDELLHEFFVLGHQFSSVDVLRLIGMDAQLIGGVHNLLDDLCSRIIQFSKSDEDGVPVLIQGGGRGMKVTLFHHPYLVSLQRVVAEAERVAALGFSLGGDSPRADSDEEDVDSKSANESNNTVEDRKTLSSLRNVRIEDPSDDVNPQAMEESFDDNQSHPARDNQSNIMMGSQQPQVLTA